MVNPYPTPQTIRVCEHGFMKADYKGQRPRELGAEVTGRWENLIPEEQLLECARKYWPKGEGPYL